MMRLLFLILLLCYCSSSSSSVAAELVKVTVSSELPIISKGGDITVNVKITNVANRAILHPVAISFLANFVGYDSRQENGLVFVSKLAPAQDKFLSTDLLPQQSLSFSISARISPSKNRIVVASVTMESRVGTFESNKIILLGPGVLR